VIYLDNAATTIRKPPEVIAAMHAFLSGAPGSPGRSGHRVSIEVARRVFEARESLARLFGAADSRQIVFTRNATESINLALYGWLRAGDHVVATSLEHNAVMRPLRHLRESRGIAVSFAAADGAGRTDAGALGAALQPNTRLVVVNHASNVTGQLLALPEIRTAIGEIPLLVDAAQSAGAVPISVERDGIDLLAFTGHKSLLGPTGIGGLYVRPGLELAPLTRGGTGSSSDSDEQPEHMPDRLESGTANTVGIIGLGAAAEWLLGLAGGIESVRRQEQTLLARLWSGLRAVPGVHLYGADDLASRLAIVSLNIEGLSAAEVALRLDRRHEIMVRGGLHCAPQAHRALGSFPDGSVRLSAGYFNAPDEMDRAVEAIREIAGRRAG
jgi:cysteine desulfurase / selenocysteine lyase